ncbi:hypothetical protein AX16_003254 [Volvariella volvacea WC 439]|nr:hypothetical protein AX16_003254 [Volvariella volvacea WC 439]
MAKLTVAFSSLLALIPIVTAQSGPWGQCGGQGWTGPTTCVSGWVCTYVNDWYSQCLQSTSTTSSSSSTSSGPLPTGTSTAGLNTLAKSKGKLYFGSATDNGELSDAPYVAILSDTKEFGQLTPGNSMKWDATEPSRGTFSFSRGDAIVDLAKRNGQIVRVNFPPGLPQEISTMQLFKKLLETILLLLLVIGVDNYVRTFIQAGFGLMLKNYISDAWDVVNEPFNEDGTFRTSVFYNTIGPSYIEIALRAARAADPTTKLYVNDYNIDGLGAKSTGMVNLVKDLKAKGAPIDGIGIQAHLIVGALPSTIQQNIEQFAALGVDVAITELDIRMTLPVTAAKLEQQKKDYQTVIAACRAVSACIGVTIWDYTDKYSWVPSVFDGQGAALPWDENLVKKPAYDGIVAGLA